MTRRITTADVQAAARVFEALPEGTTIQKPLALGPRYTVHLQRGAEDTVVSYGGDNAFEVIVAIFPWLEAMEEGNSDE